MLSLFEPTDKVNPVNFTIQFRIREHYNNLYDFEISASVPGATESVSGDPHFSQMVVDDISKDKRLICYDVTGKSGQTINLISVKYPNIKIKGELLDDYYIHSIFIQNYNRTIKITTKFIYFQKNIFKIWNESKIEQEISIGKFHIKILNSIISIKYSNFQIFEIIVERKKNILNRYFLDFNIINIRKFKKENLGGIIGDIFQKTFKFLKNVQRGDNKFAMINGKLRLGKDKSRENFSCTFFNVKHLIHPKSYSYYVYYRNSKK